MYSSPHRALKTYANVGVETGVAAADPHRLILMLFEGATLAISNARRHIQAGDVAAKGEAISKALLIIDGGLKASLDRNVGGAMTTNLAALYDYMNHRLVMANAGNDVGILDEVSHLLTEIGGAWATIGKSRNARPELASGLVEGAR